MLSPVGLFGDDDAVVGLRGCPTETGRLAIFAASLSRASETMDAEVTAQLARVWASGRTEGLG